MRLIREILDTDGAKTLLITSFVFLFCYDVLTALTIHPRNWFADEGCYMQQLGYYLNIEGDHVCGNPAFRAAGVTLVWLPFAFIGKYLAHLESQNVTEYILSLVSFGTVLFWAATFYFVKRIVSDGQRRWRDYLFVLFILLNVPSFYYVFTRPFMPHAAEAMFAFGFIFFLKQNKPLQSLLFAILLTVTRYNDAPVFLMLFAWIYENRKNTQGYSIDRRVLLITKFVLVLALAMTGWIAFVRGYDSYTVFDLLADTKWKGFYDFFISSNWGVLWSGTWWLAAFLFGFFHIKKLSLTGRAALVWMLLEAILCIGWGGNGNSYGYRYLVGSYAGALVIWLELQGLQPNYRYVFHFFTLLGGAWLYWTLLMFGVIPNTVAIWSADGLTCLNDTDAMFYTFKHAFNPDYLKQALFRQILPMQLYVQKNPHLADPKWNLTELSQTRYLLAWAASGVAGAYIVLYTAASMVTSGIKKPR